MASRTPPGRGLDPDPAAMPLNNPPTHGQPDARARILAPGVQALKNHEDALEVVRRDADAVIPDGEDAFRRARLRTHMEMRSLATAERDGLADEDLQELHKLTLVGHDGGKFVVAYKRCSLPDRDAQVCP